MTVALHRRIVKGIKALADDVSVVVLRQRKHCIIEVSRPGITSRRMPLAVSPAQEEYSIRNSINQARKLLEIP